MYRYYIYYSRAQHYPTFTCFTFISNVLSTVALIRLIKETLLSTTFEYPFIVFVTALLKHGYLSFRNTRNIYCMRDCFSTQVCREAGMQHTHELTVRWYVKGI